MLLKADGLRVADAWVILLKFLKITLQGGHYFL